MTQIPDWLDHVGPGWVPILEQLHTDVVALDPEYTVDQVKEKFGALRAYLVYQDRGVEELVEEAIRKSAVTCYDCGKPGEITCREGSGMLLCLCDSCVAKPLPEPW